ncbi:MAG: sulfurtransferase-like selenium metabolism protein YedF, partial [Desulfohalobium sp.]
ENLDCRGIPCPQPVLQAKQAIESRHPGALSISVDNDAAEHNVTRFLESQGYQIDTIERDDKCRWIRASCPAAPPSPATHCPDCEAMPAEQIKQLANQDMQLVLITSAYLGQGDDSLGQGLMKNFLATLPEMGPDLWRLILLNSGVKLAVEGSSVLPELYTLQDKGVSILVCGTCLEHFRLLAQKQVGETTNMLDVVTSLQTASKIIKI